MSAEATFLLERFAWGAPDRLEVAGRFDGLDKLPAEPAVLVVRGPDRVRRLPAVAGGDGDADGHWQAAFAWQEPPAAFEGACLELGDGVAVDLPAPRGRRRGFRREVLEVRRTADEASGGAELVDADTPSGSDGQATATAAAVVAAPADAADPAEAEAATEVTEPAAESPVDAGAPTGDGSQAMTAESPAAAEAPVTPPSPAERLGLQADLVAARAEARELQAALERATDQLVRAQEDLEASRAEHAADTERFRTDLAAVRATAEEALTAERAAAEATRAEQAAQLEDVRGRLATESEARAAAEGEMAQLRERVAASAPARDDVVAAHDDAQRLLRRLASVRDALGG